MTLTIGDTSMSSDQSGHTAAHLPDRGGWEVSWLPGQILDRNTAITAMILADTAAERDLHEGHRLWPFVQGWAAELGLTGPDADCPGRPAAQRPQPPAGTSRPAARSRGSRLTSQTRHQDQRSSPAYPCASLPASPRNRMTDV